jgi:hypothetical protein
VEAVQVPIMADGEDGFGDPPVVAETVRAFIRAGVARVNIEDQALGQPGPKGVIDRGRMVEKIRAAREAARREGEPGLVINARTDALTAASDRSAGLNESSARANQYLDAGADLASITGVATIEEVKALMRDVHGPVSMAAGLPGNIGSTSVADLSACGVARVRPSRGRRPRRDCGHQPHADCRAGPPGLLADSSREPLVFTGGRVETVCEMASLSPYCFVAAGSRSRSAKRSLAGRANFQTI